MDSPCLSKIIVPPIIFPDTVIDEYKPPEADGKSSKLSEGVSKIKRFI